MQLLGQSMVLDLQGGILLCTSSGSPHKQLAELLLSTVNWVTRAGSDAMYPLNATGLFPGLAELLQPAGGFAAQLLRGGCACLVAGAAVAVAQADRRCCTPPRRRLAVGVAGLA
jgi:hypothetical protein